MTAEDTCRLKAKDHAILETMLASSGHARNPFVELLRAKLSRAVVSLRTDIPADVVTIGSRVRYRTDAGGAQCRVLKQDDMGALVGAALPVTSLCGLALLGLAEGGRSSIEPAPTWNSG